MLKTLSVWNFALIENVNVEFDEGLNILTGETGAGKSILIDALGVVLGNRSNSQNIRNGCDDLKVEAVFLIDPQDKVQKILSEMEIDAEDETLIITRKINRSGKNSIVVNGSHITLATLKKIGNALIDIHGQNENLALLKENSPYNLIDNSSEEISTALSDYQKLYRLWISQKKTFEEKKRSAIENDERLDMLKWQEKEIEEANLTIGEDEELETEIKRISNAEKIATNVEESCALLDGDEDFNVLTALAKVNKNLDEVQRYDKSLESAQKMLEEATIILNEVFSEVRNYADQIDFSPGKIDELFARLDKINLLKKKYGSTIEEILNRYEKIKQELSNIENFDADIVTLQQLILKLESQARKRAEILTNARNKSAKILSMAIEKELRPLGMKKAKFLISIKPNEELTLNGADEVDMLFSANAGEEVRSLSKIASGGELSRVALAIKTINANRDDSAATMVFDEIDAGLGGTTANAVAECIAKVAKYRQVLCITHLAQIACMADVHISISKLTEENRTITQVARLNDSERLREIARMASGDDATPASMENARVMITNANNKKRVISKFKN